MTSAFFSVILMPVAVCKACGCSGWFFPLSKAGLCHSCAHLIELEVAQRQEAIEDSARLADQTADPRSKLARLDVMLANLDALARLEGRGIPTGKAPAAESLKARRAERDRLLLETAQRALDETMSRLPAAPSPEAKLSLLNTLLLQLSEFKAKAEAPAPLASLERKVKDSVILIKLNLDLEKAQEAEKRRDFKTALALYEEALTCLKASDMDAAARAKHALKINGKLKELKNR